jgi:hypothetical protein
MRDLTKEEIDNVSGGNVVIVILAIISAGYVLGKDAAERDNRRDQ